VLLCSEVRLPPTQEGIARGPRGQDSANIIFQEFTAWHDTVFAYLHLVAYCFGQKKILELLCRAGGVHDFWCWHPSNICLRRGQVSELSESKIWSWVPWDSEPKITTLARTNSSLAASQSIKCQRLLPQAAIPDRPPSRIRRLKTLGSYPGGEAVPCTLGVITGTRILSFRGAIQVVTPAAFPVTC
jgi:hypothetical protein